MSILSGITIRKLCHEQNLVIQSKDPKRPFDVDCQVTEDAIDLRISNHCKVVARNVREIDVGQPDNTAVFDDLIIPESGYRLKPGRVLYTNTLEVVSLPDNLAGRVCGRSTFARMGLSVHCTHPKLAIGHKQAIPLQLVNHNNVDVIIYPYAPIVQLQLEEVSGPVEPYGGKYRGESDYTGPIVTARDQQITSVSTRTRRLIEREIEEIRREMLERAEKQIKRQGEDKEIKEGDIRMITIPKKRVDMLQGVLYTLGGIALAWGLSISVEGSELDRWKITALIATALAGVVMLVVAYFLQYYES